MIKLLTIVTIFVLFSLPSTANVCNPSNVHQYSPVLQQNITSEKSVCSEFKIDFPYTVPKKIYIFAPNKVQTIFKKSSKGKIEYVIEAQNKDLLNLQSSAFEAYYTPSTNLLVIFSLDYIKCEYSYTELNGYVTSNNLTGSCLKQVIISSPNIQQVEVQSVSLIDLYFMAPDLDPDMVKFFETTKEKIQNPGDRVIDLTINK